MSRSVPSPLPYRVLITGGTGLLGKALLETLPASAEATATYRQHPPPISQRFRFIPLDVRDPSSVRQVVEEVRPDFVVHAASIGEVDEAERNPQRVWEVNVRGTQRIAEASRAIDAFLLYVSSNAVFDGKNPPYSEEVPPRPANRYGAFKREAELSVLRSGADCLVLRPILMYGWPWPAGRGNVVTRWLYAMETGQPVQVAQGIFSMPLFAAQCAQVIWACLAKRMRGVLHVAGRDRLSLVEFARTVSRVFGLDEQLVVPVPSARLPMLAPRPPDTSFVTARMESELGIQPTGVEEGLRAMRQSRVTSLRPSECAAT